MVNSLPQVQLPVFPLQLEMAATVMAVRSAQSTTPCLTGCRTRSVSWRLQTRAAQQLCVQLQSPLHAGKSESASPLNANPAR